MKKLNTAFIILFITICTNVNLIAQSNDNLDYFPHKTGDMWEYFYDDYSPLYVDTAQVFTVFDSTDSEGNIFVTQTNRYINPIQVPAVPFFPDTMHYRIDTLNQVWGGVGELENVLAFKLNANQGDQWILKTYYDNGEPVGYEMARVALITEANFFGHSYTVMSTVYYAASNSTDTLGLSRYGQALAKGLGTVWLGGGESSGEVNLKGAVIDGVLYGDTTNIITSVTNHNDNILPITLELEQNYPNPFNPTTQISYQIPKNSFVNLVVYNALGQVVAKLVNQQQSMGKYTVNFNASNLPSGIYIYKLQAGEFSSVKKMLLTK